MDYIQKCFSETSGWNDDMSYEQILRTPNNLLQFKIPSGFQVSVASKNTENSYSSATLRQLNRLNGSVSYFYSSNDMKNAYKGTGTLPLWSVIDDYRFIRSPKQERVLQRRKKAEKKDIGDRNPYLLYGKMYFPSQFLEGMIVKRLSDSTQMTLRFINTPKFRKLTKNCSILTLYLQRQNDHNATDFIYSSTESLLGLRCLYKLGSDFSLSSSPGYTDSTSLSAGFELWFALLSMSPGLSTAVRYSTHISSSGKPLTMTLALNPLLGTIESTYSIKPGLNSTFCSKYTFNIYSYESDFLLGFSLFRCNGYNPPSPQLQSTNKTIADSPDKVSFQTREIHTENLQPNRSNTIQRNDTKKVGGRSDKYPFNVMDEDQHHQLLTTFMGITPGKLLTENNARHFLDTFNRSQFSSAFKCAASVARKDVKFAWEGRFKDLLLSSGVHIDCNDSIPRVDKCGLEIQYSS